MLSRIFLTIICLVIFFSINISFGQSPITDGAYLWSLNVGYGSTTNGVSANSLNGWSGGTTIEKMLGKSNWALGFNFSFFSTSDEYKISDVAVAQSFGSYGLYLGFKHYVRSLGEWVPYIGLAIGSSFTDRYTSATGEVSVEGENVYQGRETLSSFSGAVPIGINWFVSEKAFIGLNLTTIWADKTFYKSNVNMIAILAIGFNVD